MKIDKIIVGKLECNCYIVIKDKNCIIIDPGDEFNKIDKYIKSNNLKVVAIFITHYHFDHIGALDECKKNYNVKVYDYSTYVNDDKRYKVDEFNFKIIDSRGHKDDLVTFYFYNENVMFTGDFIFRDSIGRCDLEGSDFELMKLNIEKIKNYNDDIIIYPGHGEETSLGYEKLNNEYFID